MSNHNRKLFKWTSFDVSSSMHENWSIEIIQFAKDNAKLTDLYPTSVTSRESSDVEKVPVLTVGGVELASGLPWLVDLYHGLFRDLAQTITNEKVSTVKNIKHGINLNVQRGSEMRYEAHIDTNPIEGLLYATTHRFGEGGELVVGNCLNVYGIEQIDSDCSCIYPVAGHLVFFDAREHSHYVRKLQASNDMRVVAAMNFYTPSCSEDDRPIDLDDHLGLNPKPQ